MRRNDLRSVREIITVLLVVLLATLAACQSSPSPTPSRSPAATDTSQMLPDIEITSPNSHGSSSDDPAQKVYPTGDITVFVEVINFNVVNRMGQENHQPR